MMALEETSEAHQTYYYSYLADLKICTNLCANSTSESWDISYDD